LKFETRSRISSRSELFKLTVGIRFASTIVGGVDGSTRMPFVSAAVSLTSLSKSALRSIILCSPQHPPIQHRGNGKIDEG